MGDQLGFKPKARLILQLGDQLIRSESIALLELIKNSYDACASRVTITLTRLDSKEYGQIVIEDDGFGMDYNLIKDVWLQPGTTHKKNQIEAHNFVSECNRIPLGEKGIGRFGVHKLGEEIELISKTKTSDETYLKINWKDFDNDESLEKIPINLTRRIPNTFAENGHGTKIIIKALRTTWTRGAVREIYRAINSLNSPFDSIDSFKVLFKLDRQDWLSGLLKFKDIKDSALFSADILISGNKIEKLDYKFTPYSTMNDLRHRIHSEVGVDMVQRIYDESLKKKVFQDIDISKYQIGKVKIKMLIFDFDTNILSLGVADKKGLKDYLKLNGGMRVYRDSIRVYDYGEPGNDWLSLDIDRVNLPTARISNNIVIGAVELDRLSSKDLIEKTNREGFIENDAYSEFYKAVRFAINRVITQRNIDKDKLRSHYSKTKTRKVPVVDNIEILRERVNLTLPDTKIRQEIIGIIDEIASDYKTISDIYIRSASAGLSLSIVIHEIEKIIQELLYVVDDVGKPNSDEKVKALTWHLSKLVDGYSGLIRRRSRKESDLKKVINNALWNVEYRLKAHGINILTAFESEKDFDTKVRCSDSLIVGTIINIIDNSIYWMSHSKVQNQTIFFDLVKQDNFIIVIIADNGPGFTIPQEDAVRPFISNKEDGIGIGLHIADEIMKSNGGQLLFPSIDIIDFPKDFNPGAILGLAFDVSEK